RQPGRPSGYHPPAAQRAERAATNDAGTVAPHSELTAALSASLREALLREIEALDSSDDAALWSQRRLGANNSLVASDATLVEQAFRTRLTMFGTEPAGGAARQQGKRRGRRRHPGRKQRASW